MKKITYYELLGAIFIASSLTYLIIYILIEQSRGLIFHAFNVANISITCLFVLLLIIPLGRIKLKIDMIDKIVTVITNISLAFSFAFTLYSWGTTQNHETPQVSLLDIIKNHDHFYYVAFLFLSLGLLYSAIKPILLYWYDFHIKKNMNKNRLVHSIINGFTFSAKKTKEGITGILTGTSLSGAAINYIVTKKSASELINDINQNYPEIKLDVLNTFLDTAKLIE
ncbi:TPA: hypothetical protein QH450_002428 [Providencia alcalifaciens]|nr:hypothetical protein [Providencia alcalifaciens]